MKKFDLRKTRASSITESSDDVISFDKEKKSILSDISIDPKIVINIILRLALCALGTYILIHFEQQELDRLLAKKATLEKTLEKSKNIIISLEKEIKTYGALPKKAEHFKNRLNIMQKIVKYRLLPIKSLDQIQSIIPKDIFLKNINYTKKRIIFTGVGNTMPSIHTFIQSLEGTTLFANIVLQRVSQETHNKFFHRRAFIIESVLK